MKPLLFQLDTTIRAVGAMAYDETRITEVHPKVAGWVERTFVDSVGKTVRKGQPLLTIYSPELLSTQHEYLLASRAREQLGTSAFGETRRGASRCSRPRAIAKIQMKKTIQGRARPFPGWRSGGKRGKDAHPNARALV